MTKILVPILILAGLVLGVLYLLARRKVAVPAGTSPSRALVMMAAASVAGILGTSGCKDKKAEEPRTMCYKTTRIEDVSTASDDVRTDALDKLHEAGKISDEVYVQTLAQIEKEKWFRNKDLTDEEQAAISDLRKQNGELVAMLESEKQWKALGLFVDKLVVKLGKTGMGATENSGYDSDKVTKLVGDLQEQEQIDEATGNTLATVLEEVNYHHDRSNSGKTCHKMKMLGVQMSGWRGDLTRMIQDIEQQEPTDDAYVEHLGTLAAAMSCFEEQTEETCDAGPSEGPDRVAMVRPLDLLIALVR
jgi:hypothetical protein